MPGLRVLLSNYVALVISRGPGILSGFSHPSGVVSLVLQNLIGAGVRCPFLPSRASWRRLGTPPPLLLGLRASLYRPNQTRDNRNGRLLYPVRAVRCSLDRFAAHRQRCERFLFAAGCSTKELSKTTVSAPDAVVTGMPVLGYGTVCSCTLSSVHSCCRSVSSFRRTLLSSWREGEYVALAHILAVLLLRGCCPSVLRRLLPGLCGGSAGPGFTRACSPRHITAY